jgi:pyruvate dehydrogenase E1 component
MIGATAGRTTLTGEGLQHADGHSHTIAETNPAVVSYDPAYGYEIGHIMADGLERMYGGSHPDPNVMYYITVYNEPMAQPVEPEGLDVDGVVRGIYKLKDAENLGPRAQLLASGVGVPWALEAQQLLADDWNVARHAPFRRPGRSYLPLIRGFIWRNASLIKSSLGLWSL